MLTKEELYKAAVDCGLIDPRDALPEGFVQELLENLAEFSKATDKSHAVLGYVREEMLEACRSAKQGMPLTVVPVAPKSGRWVPIYAEGEKVTVYVKAGVANYDPTTQLDKEPF